MKFTFLKIPVHIHPSFFLLLLMFLGITGSISATSFIYIGVVFFSLLVHEYGHGFTARYFGASPRIELNLMGGLTSYNNIGLSKKQQFFITLNGPLFESLLIFIPFLILKSNLLTNPHINFALYLTMKVNIFWCLINLMPLLPLDGGKLLKYILNVKMGDRGSYISLIVSCVSAGLGSLYFLINHNYFIGFIFVSYGIQNLQMFMQFRSAQGKPSDFYLYNESLKAVDNNDLKKAKNILNKLIKTKVNNKIQISAKESLANILYKGNEKEKAYKLLLDLDHNELKQGKCLLCNLAYGAKNYELIAKLSRDIYEIDPSFETAILNSKAFAGLNSPALSSGWLKTASLFDGVNSSALKEHINEEIYSSVREHIDFKDYIENIYV